MMDVHTAVKNAIDYVGSFSNIFPSSDMRLEETEIDDYGDWLITLSFLENPLTGNRIYKIFRIDSNSGQVKAMKGRAAFNVVR